MGLSSFLDADNCCTNRRHLDKLFTSVERHLDKRSVTGVDCCLGCGMHDLNDAGAYLARHSYSNR